MQARRQGMPVPELDTPPLPPDLAPVLHLFRTLSLRRPRGETGPRALQFSEIEAWSRLTATEITPLEVRLIIDLDTVWLAVMARHRAERHQ